MLGCVSCRCTCHERVVSVSFVLCHADGYVPPAWNRYSHYWTSRRGLHASKMASYGCLLRRSHHCILRNRHPKPSSIWRWWRVPIGWREPRHRRIAEATCYGPLCGYAHSISYASHRSVGSNHPYPLGYGWNCRTCHANSAGARVLPFRFLNVYQQLPPEPYKLFCAALYYILHGYSHNRDMWLN